MKGAEQKQIKSYDEMTNREVPLCCHGSICIYLTSVGRQERRQEEDEREGAEQKQIKSYDEMTNREVPLCCHGSICIYLTSVGRQ